MIAIRFKALLAVCVFAACLPLSHSSLAQDCLKGDVNLDGTVNMADVLPFLELLADENSEYLCEADNGDGIIDFNDAPGIRDRILAQQGAPFTNTVTDGAGDFFWSMLNLNEGAVNGPIDLNLSPGETATLFLYYSTNGPSNSQLESGYSVNVATSQAGIIKFTEAETFNHPITFGSDNIFGNRWDFPARFDNDGEGIGVGVGPVHSVEDDLIIGLTAMRLTQGTGMTVGLDSGYDTNAQAFLCGSIQIEALAAGTIELAAGPNDVGIADQNVLLQSAFSRVNISVEREVLLGDVSLDGMVNFSDIGPFIQHIVSGGYLAEADCNEDSYVDFNDISFFIDILASN